MEKGRGGQSGSVGPRRDWVALSSEESKMACCGLCYVTTTFISPPESSVKSPLPFHTCVSGFSVGNLRRLNSGSGYSHGMKWRQCILYGQQ